MNTIEPKDRAICLELGDEALAYHGAVAPPLFLNSLFSFKKIELLHRALADEKNAVIYRRGNNPTTMLAEQKIAALERAESAKLFSSGMAAISSVLFTLCASGSHVLCVNSIYGPTLKYLNYLKKFGVTYTVLHDATRESVESAVQSNTAVLYCESPGTMTFRVLDLSMLVEIAQERGITTVIDNTWATPLFQKPIEYGFDISIHSCTKYMGGHSDIVAGVVAGKKAIIERVFDEAFMQHGGVPGPFEALLLLRGLRTLPDRMLRHQSSAYEIAEYVSSHDKVTRVYYPGLSTDECHALSKKYFYGYSGVFSFEVSEQSYTKLCDAINKCKHFRIGVSWGGYESLIFSPFNGSNAEQLKEKRIPLGLIRISVGLEDTSVLKEDLAQMLSVL